MTLDVRSEQSVQKDSANHFFFFSGVYYYNGFDRNFNNSMAGNARKDIGFSKVDAGRFLFFRVWSCRASASCAQ